VLPVSAPTGEGMSAWYEWLRHEAAAVHDRAWEALSS
jgi:hypothetical protein